MPREERQELETGQSYSFGSQRNNTPFPPPLSPVSIFIASQFQFTGSSGNQGQGQRCDCVED